MKKTILAGSVLTFAPLKIVSFYAPDKLLGKKQRIMITASICHSRVWNFIHNMVMYIRTKFYFKRGWGDLVHPKNDTKSRYSMPGHSLDFGCCKNSTLENALYDRSIMNRTQCFSMYTCLASGIMRAFNWAQLQAKCCKIGMINWIWSFSPQVATKSIFTFVLSFN